MSLSTPVLADWTALKSYDGASHEYGWEPTGYCNHLGDPDYYECWHTWELPEHRCAFATSSYGRPASAATHGTIRVTFVWDPSSGNPPEYATIRETASALWEVGSYGNGAILSAKGWATSSLGGTYQEGPIPNGLPDWKQGEYECVRHVKVDSSSGEFTRSASFFVRAEGVVSEAGRAVLVTCDFSVQLAGGIDVPTVIVDPPGRDAAPLDHPTGDDPVNLATGAQSSLLAPDIVSYNPYGPSPAYTRNYHSGRAKSNYASPGLSAGWVDNYDVSMTAVTPGAWGALKLVYPNSAEESITPILSGGQPTGGFTAAAGAPYFAVGSPSGTAGQWQSVTITFGDQSQWILTPAGSNTYRLGKIANAMGRYISILRDSSKGYRVKTIEDDSSPVNNLLTFAYSGDHLASITDAYGRKVAYTFGTAAGATCLLSFSGVVPSQTASPAARTTYGYTAIGNPARARLTSTSDPSPTGSGSKTDTIDYYTEPSDSFSYGKVKSLVDDHGNKHEYIYESDAYTRVRVKNPAGDVEAEWVANFDPANRNRSTGIADNDNHYTNVFYTDSQHPSKPTISVDKTGKQTSVTYDQHGNILTSKDARGTVTTLTYNDSVFPLGRLTSVQQGSKPATTFTYFEPSGLLESITRPEPGTTGSSTVTTWFTYDDLGNVKTVKKPNASSTVTTVYGYGSQPKLGQPLTVADVADPLDEDDPGWLRMIHLSYDARGNMISATDAEGNKVDYTYNVANQPLLTIFPETP